MKKDERQIEGGQGYLRITGEMNRRRGWRATSSYVEGMEEGVVARNEHAFEQEPASLLLRLRAWVGGKRINVRVLCR